VLGDSSTITKTVCGFEPIQWTPPAAIAKKSNPSKPKKRLAGGQETLRYQASNAATATPHRAMLNMVSESNWNGIIA